MQTVLRPNLDYRGYAGQIASGVVRPGDEVIVLPSRRTTRVVGIDTYGEPVSEAFAPMSVTLRLADEIDVSRGDMIVHAGSLPRVEQRFDAMVVWLQEKPLDRARSYFLKHTTRTVRAEVEAVAYKVDLDSLENVPAEGLGLNDIARVTVRTQRPLFVDAYRANRTTGAFILIDSLTNDTVAAGMILEATGPADQVGAAGGPSTQVTAAERRARVGHGGAAVVLAQAGTEAEQLAVAYAVERQLFDRGHLAVVVSGESAEAAAAACVEAGVIAICAGSRLAGAALRERLGAERVVAVRAGTAAEVLEEALRGLVERGVV